MTPSTSANMPIAPTLERQASSVGRSCRHLASLPAARQVVQADGEERPDQEEARHQCRHVLVRIAERERNQPAHRARNRRRRTRWAADGRGNPASPRRATGTACRRRWHAPRETPTASHRSRGSSTSPPYGEHHRNGRSASSTASGSSAINACPQPGSVTVLRLWQRVDQRGCISWRRHDVATAQISKAGHRQRAAAASPFAYAWQAARSVWSTPGAARSINRIPLPVIHIPGTALPPSCLPAL